MRSLLLLPGAAAALLAAALATFSCAPSSSPRAAPAPPPEPPHDQVVRIAAAIRKAAYAGDTERLRALFEQMAPLEAAGAEGSLASRARYWRGFALWRGAWNAAHEPGGASDGGADADFETGLRGAVEEFEQSAALDATFVDARIAQLACLESLAPWIPASERPREYKRLWDLLAEAQKQAPENPRLAWVLGNAKWETPVKQGGGQEKAIQTYRDGLEFARKQTIADATDPAWGEAELLMSLALARLQGKPQNLDAADHYAHAALNIEPEWRYVKETLLSQIQAAREAALITPTPTPIPKSKARQPTPRPSVPVPVPPPAPTS